MKDIFILIVQFCEQNFLLVSIVLSVLCALIPAKFNILKILLKGVLKFMGNFIRKFRTEQDAFSCSKNEKGQTFSSTKPVYRLNKVSGELVETEDKVNIKEMINSAVNLALDGILDRLLPVNPVDNQVAEFNLMQDDLDYLLGASQLAEDYKSKFNLDSSMSIAQVFDFVGNKAKDLKVEIEKAEAIAKAKEELLKGGVKNEKTIVEKSE